MHILLFDCVICSKTDKKPRRMGLKKAEHNAADNKWVAQCMGCGKFTIKIVDDKRIAELSQ